MKVNLIFNESSTQTLQEVMEYYFKQFYLQNDGGERVLKIRK